MCHGTRILPTLVPLPLYPWYPMPTTYIHTCIDTFVLFIYLSYCLCVYLSYCLCLSYSSLLSCSVSSRSLLALGKACPWAEAAGLISLVCVNVLFYLIIIQQYTCMVWYVRIHMYCIVYVCTSSIMYVSNRWMYVHSVVCIVLCTSGPVYVQQYTWCAVQYGLPVHGVPLVYSLCVSHTCYTQCAIYSLVCLRIIKRHCVSYTMPILNSF